MKIMKYRFWQTPNLIFLTEKISYAYVAGMGKMRSAYNILIGKPEGKRALGRPRRRWEYNIKMDLREIGWKGVDWIRLAQDRDQWWDHVNTVMNLWVP
jgi:hypothetical protein